MSNMWPNSAQLIRLKSCGTHKLSSKVSVSPVIQSSSPVQWSSPQSSVAIRYNLLRKCTKYNFVRVCFSFPMLVSRLLMVNSAHWSLYLVLYYFYYYSFIQSKLGWIQMDWDWRRGSDCTGRSKSIYELQNTEVSNYSEPPLKCKP